MRQHFQSTSRNLLNVDATGVLMGALGWTEKGQTLAFSAWWWRPFVILPQPLPLLPCIDTRSHNQSYIAPCFLLNLSDFKIRTEQRRFVLNSPPMNITTFERLEWKSHWLWSNKFESFQQHIIFPLNLAAYQQPFLKRTIEKLQTPLWVPCFFFPNSQHRRIIGRTQPKDKQES